MKKKEYTAVSLDGIEADSKQLNYNSAFNYDSNFDFRSIAKFDKASFPSKSYFTFTKQASPPKETMADDSCLTRLVTAALLALVYSLVLVTLPVTGWWTVRRVQRWQRLVVFRVGRALAMRGPGWTLLLPWLDVHHTVDLRNKAILVPPQQLITCDGGVVELGAEVRYRICDPLTFVGACVDPSMLLRSLAKTTLVSTLSAQELSVIVKRSPAVEQTVLLSINSQLKDWGMEASAVKFSEVKAHKEAEPLSAISPLLRQLGGLLGGGGGAGPSLVAGQPPMSAASPAGLAAQTAAPLAAQTTAPLAVDAETAAVVRTAVARVPAAPSLAAGVYRINTTQPDGLCHVVIDDAGGRMVDDPAAELAVDVSVTLTSSDLRQLAAGTLSPVTAYGAGRLRVQGNIHLLMALGELLRHSAHTTAGSGRADLM